MEKVSADSAVAVSGKTSGTVKTDKKHPCSDLRSHIEKAKGGDEDAFEVLLKQYRPLVESEVQSALRHHSDSESVFELDENDLRQEATIAFYKAVLGYDLSQTSVTLGAYAQTCIENRLKSYRKSECRHQLRISDDEPSESLPASGGDPCAHLLENESYAALCKKVEKLLSPREASIWKLYLSGRTAKDIADHLGTNRKSAENAIFRIRQKLRKYIPYP